jgi:hypothetical protein
LQAKLQAKSAEISVNSQLARSNKTAESALPISHIFAKRQKKKTRFSTSLWLSKSVVN